MSSFGDNRYTKSIVDTETKKVICNAEALSNAFIENIIKEHNEAISSAIEKYFLEGYNFRKDLYK